MEPSAPLDALRAFRGALYRCLDRRADALFELGDYLKDYRDVEEAEGNMGQFIGRSTTRSDYTPVSDICHR